MTIMLRLGAAVIVAAVALGGLGFSVVHAAMGPYNCCGTNNCAFIATRQACPQGNNSSCSSASYPTCCHNACNSD
jgi:hypothetical protein